MIKSALFATLLTACALASANNPLYEGSGNHSPTSTDSCCSTLQMNNPLYESTFNSPSPDSTTLQGSNGDNPLFSGF